MPENLNTFETRLTLAKAYLAEETMKQEAIDQIDVAIDIAKKQINNKDEIMRQMANALTLLPCGCTREYPYNGVGKTMCVRCRALVLYEVHATGKSDTQIAFERKRP